MRMQKMTRLGMLISTALCACAHAAAAGDAYAPLRLYAGAWQVTKATAPTGKPDRLVNDCAQAGHYFVCQQTVNGKPGALVVFIPDRVAGQYHNQVVLPDGAALGPPGTLVIAGEHWTYLSQPDPKGVRYRTTNVFHGRDHIHFDVAQSSDGKTWTATMAGDETRVR